MRTNAELSTSIRDILDDPTMKDKLSDNQRATLKDAERALLKDGDPFADMLGSMFKAAPSILLAQYDGENEVMTVHYSNGDVARFKGTGTVWNKMPMMARCSTQLEQTLTSILTYVKQWGNPYPNAHVMKDDQK
jgi:hypothetical protein